jgi:hypothetical protein
MGAADKGVQRLDTVDKAMSFQEFKRAIDGRWCGLPPAFIEGIENRVGADRLMTAPDQFQDAPPRFRQSQSLAGAYLRRNCDRIINAALMVVAASEKRSVYDHAAS